jgi:hypothetical protein
MRIYDVFQEKWITESEIDSIAPPERYIYIDVPDVPPYPPVGESRKSLEEVIAAIEFCNGGEGVDCTDCLYEGADCQIDKLLNDALYYLKRYKKGVYG